jgi:MFS family permease
MKGLFIFMASLFRNKYSHLYLASVVTDNVGSSLMLVMLPLLVLDLTKDNIHLPIISAIETIPFLILGIPLGAFADRSDVKKNLLFADLIRIFPYAILSGFLFFCHNPAVLLTLIYCSVTIVSCANVLGNISEITFISSFVEKQQYSKMNSAVYGIQYCTGLVVPLLGGIMYSRISGGLLSSFCALSFLASLLFLITIPKINTSVKRTSLKHPWSTLINDGKVGLRYVLKKRQSFIR